MQEMTRNEPIAMPARNDAAVGFTPLAHASPSSPVNERARKGATHDA
jgi:hypothetical protein